MISGLAAVSVAAAAAGGGLTDSLLAPTGGLVVAAGLLLQAARTWREARGIDVTGAKEEAVKQKTRADEVERTSNETLARSEERYRVLDQKYDTMVTQHDNEMATLRAQKDSEIAGLRAELVQARSDLYARDTMLADKGWLPNGESNKDQAPEG